MGNRSVVAFGIPTLDYSFIVPDKSVVDKFGLNNDSQLEMSYQALEQIKRELNEKQYKCKKLIGGNCQVSLTIFQSLMQKPHQTLMFGAVGDDEEGEFLEKHLNKNSIDVKFDKIKNKKTAITVIVVHKVSRSIAVMNGVGSEYSLEQCSDLKTKLDIVKSSAIVLFEGFFIGYSYDIALPVIHECKKNGNIVATNISAVYILENYPKEFVRCVPMCDVLIGNLTEFKSLCKIFGFDSRLSISQQARAIQNIMLSDEIETPSKLECMKTYKKIVIITNNKNPVYCVYGDSGIFIKLKIPSIDENKIKDTSGAGDSFLAGFLYGLVNAKSIEKCLEIGSLIACKVIQQHGYNIDNFE